MPSRCASLKIVGAPGLAAGGSMRAAPSSSEYSEWTWRWTKLSSGAVMRCASTPQRHDIHSIPGDCGELHRCDSCGAPTYARPRGASRSLVAGSAQGSLQVVGQRLLELDPPAGERMAEGDAPGV